MLNEVDENLSRALTNDVITGILDLDPAFVAVERERVVAAG